MKAEGRWTKTLLPNPVSGVQQRLFRRHGVRIAVGRVSGVIVVAVITSIVTSGRVSASLL